MMVVLIHFLHALFNHTLRAGVRYIRT